MGLEVAGVKGAKKIAAGISGQRSTHMNARLDKDILQKRPEWMTFSCGVNDVWHGRGGVPLEQYKKLVTDIFDRAAASNVNVIVLTPTVIGENLENAENAKLAGYVAWLKEEAARRKLRLADLNADIQAEIRRIRAAEPGRKGFLVTSDGVHMAFPGDCVMAWGVLRAMGVTFREIIATLGYEQLLVSVASIAAGFLLGGVASHIFFSNLFIPSFLLILIYINLRYQNVQHLQ